MKYLLIPLYFALGKLLIIIVAYDTHGIHVEDKRSSKMMSGQCIYQQKLTSGSSLKFDLSKTIK